MIVQQMEGLTENQARILNSIEGLAGSLTCPENGIPDNFRKVERTLERMTDGRRETRRYIGLQAENVSGVHVPPKTDLDFIRMYLERLADSSSRSDTELFINVGKSHYYFDENSYSLYKEVP